MLAVRMGKGLEAMRKARGLTLREMSLELGVAPTTVFRMELGERIKPDTISRLLSWIATKGANTVSKAEVLRAYDALYQARVIEARASLELAKARAGLSALTLNREQATAAVNRAQTTAEEILTKSLSEEVGGGAITQESTR